MRRGCLLLLMAIGGLPACAARESADAVPPLGRSGDGPGEYRIIHAVGFDSAGGVLAYSLLNRRLVRFDPSSGRSETHQLPMPPTYLDATLVAGRVLAVANPGGAAGDSAEVGVYALEPGARAGRLLRPLGARDVTFPLDAMREMPGLFAPTTRWALAPDGAVWHSTGREWSVRRYPADGGPTLVVRASVEGRAVTPGDIEGQVGARLRRLPAGPMRDAAEARLRNAATRHPPITDLHPALDGGAWVREAPREGMDSVAWVLLARDGAPRGRLWLADADRPLVARDSTVLLVRDGRAEGAALVRAVLRGP